MTNNDEYDIEDEPEANELITLAIFPDAMSAGFFRSLLEEEDIYAFIQNESGVEAEKFNLQIRRRDAVAAYEIIQETLERARAVEEGSDLALEEGEDEADGLDQADDEEDFGLDDYDDDPVTVEAQDAEPGAGDMSGMRLLLGVIVFILVLLVLGHFSKLF